MQGSKQDYVASGNACPLKCDQQPVMLSPNARISGNYKYHASCMRGPWMSLILKPSANFVHMQFSFIYSHRMSNCCLISTAMTVTAYWTNERVTPVQVITFVAFTRTAINLYRLHASTGESFVVTFIAMSLCLIITVDHPACLVTGLSMCLTRVMAVDWRQWQAACVWSCYSQQWCIGLTILVLVQQTQFVFDNKVWILE